MSASTKSKIKAGLALRGKPTNFESLAPLAGAPLTIADLNALVLRAIDVRKHLAVTAETVAKRLATYEHERAVALADMGKVREQLPSGAMQISDTWSDVERTAQLRREVSAERKRLAAEVGEDSSAAMRKLREISSQISAVRSGWEDAPALLRRSTLKESGRRIMRDNLAGTGPKHLQDAIRTAVATNDKVLLAAVLDELEQLPPEQAAQINFSRTEAAALVLGETFTDAQHNLASFDLAVLESEKHYAYLEGKPTADLDLRIGLARRAVATWAGDEELAASLAKAAQAGEPENKTEDATRGAE